MKLLKNPWVRLCVAAGALAVVYLVLRYYGVSFRGYTKERLRDTIRSFGIWGPVLYIVIYLLRPLILFPAGVMSAAAGFIWGLWGFVYLQIAANVSSTAEFFFSRYFGRSAVAGMLKWHLLDLDEKIARRGFITVLLIRLIPNVAWDIQNLSLGLTGVKFRDYFFATMIGIIPGSFALVYFGASIIEVLSNPKNFWMLIVATVIFMGIYLFQKKLRAGHGDKT